MIILHLNLTWFVPAWGQDADQISIALLIGSQNVPCQESNPDTLPSGTVREALAGRRRVGGNGTTNLPLLPE